MADEKNLSIIKDVMPLLEKAANVFCSKIDSPSLIPCENDFVVRYVNPTSLHVQILMAVRIVSGINACIVLVEHGYAQEIGVLIRTIEEFLLKINFINEAHEKKILTKEQEKFINEYFKDDIRSEKDVFDRKNVWIDMDKVCASFARFVSEGTNNRDIHGLQIKLRAVYDVYSHYVHGGYGCIMEMYNSSIDSFTLNGMKGTRRISGILGGGALASCIVRALNTFGQIALNVNEKLLFKELIEKRREVWQSDLYPEHRKRSEA